MVSGIELFIMVSGLFCILILMTVVQKFFKKRLKSKDRIGLCLY